MYSGIEITRNHPKSLERKLREIAEQLEFHVSELKGKSRKREIVFARHLYCYLMRNQGYTLGAIGHSLNRDHTTVINAIDKASNYIETKEPLFIDYITKVI